MSDDPDSCDVQLVDDDVSIRETLSLVLELEGYCVRAASDGLEALEQLRAGLRPRLILLDLMMPVMSGWEFREEQLRDPRFAGIPVVLISGEGRIEQRVRELHTQGGLRKPFDLEMLLRAVQTYCPRYQAADVPPPSPRG